MKKVPALFFIHNRAHIAHPRHLFSSPRKRFSTSRCRRSFQGIQIWTGIKSPRLQKRTSAANVPHARRCRAAAYRTEHFVKLAYRSTMTALHIIGINLQLRLGIHMRFASGAKITVRLLGTRRLRTRTYQYQTGKSTDRLVVEHILKEFVAGTVGHSVVYGGIVVHMLVLIRNSHPAKVQFSTFAGKRNFGCVAGGINAVRKSFHSAKHCC